MLKNLMNFLGYNLIRFFIFISVKQMHWPVALKKDAQGTAPEDFAPLNIKGTWTAMEKCYHSGKAKAIGISNFSVEKIKDLLSYCKVRPAVNQVECHPLWQQKKLWPYLKSEGIHLTVCIGIHYKFNFSCHKSTQGGKMPVHSSCSLQFSLVYIIKLYMF